MLEYNRSFHNGIAKLCLEHFNNKISKTGKPNANEWTVLTCLVKCCQKTKAQEVVALGTGTKCIGQSKMSSNGDILNDTHAEVICRRAFLKYLYEQIKICLKEEPSVCIFNQKNQKFTIPSNYTFHLFTTLVPCGDASIFEKQTDECFGNQLLKLNEDGTVDDPIPVKKIKKDSADIYRTGAKCLPEDNFQDLHLPGKFYHTVGVVRTKPG